MKIFSSRAAAVTVLILSASLAGCDGGSSNSNNSGVFVYVDADGSNIADGTRENPMTLPAAIDLPADAIVLLSTGGPIVGNFELIERQWLLGAGDDGSLDVILPWGERLDLNGLGPRPVMEGVPDPSAETSSLRLVSDNQVLGIAIVGGTFPITAEGAANLVIEDVVMSRFAGYGMNLRDCPAALLLDLQIESGGIQALSVDNMILDGLVFSDNGVAFFSADESLTVANVVGDDTTSIGLDSRSGAVITESIVTGFVSLMGQSVSVRQIDALGLSVGADQADIQDIQIRSDPTLGGGAVVGVNIGTRFADAEVILSDALIDAQEVGIKLISFPGDTMTLSGDRNTVTTAPVICDTEGGGMIAGTLVVNGESCL